MSKDKKKRQTVTMTDLVGNTGLKARKISGRQKNHEDELKPCLTVEILEGGADFEDKSFEFMFLTKKAQASLEESAYREDDEDGNEQIYVKVPAPDTSKGMTWVTDPYE